MRPPPVATVVLLQAVPRAYRRLRPRAMGRVGLIASLVATTLLSPACTTECRGPACEDSYPLGRVDVLDDLSLDGATVGIDAVASGAVVGGLASGSSFSAAAAPGGLVVGQPEASQVLYLPVPEGDQSEADALHVWSSSRVDFGRRVAVVPHDDGVGWDLIIAAPAADRQRGIVQIFLDAHDQPTDPSVTLLGTTEGDRLGDDLRLCPDRSGDGRPELLLTAPWMQATEVADVPPLAGAVLLVDSESISPDLATDTQVSVADVATTWWGEDAGDGLGMGVDCSNDLDGDGRFDLVLGAPWANGSAGRMYVLSSAAGLDGGTVAEAAVIADGQGSDLFATSVTTFLLDDAPQILAGAPGAQQGRGAARWYDGRTIGTSGTLLLRSEFVSERTTTDHLGRTVATAELDGDDRPDLLIGGPDRRQGRLYDIGQLLVFRGATAWADVVGSEEADLTITDEQGFRRVGRVVTVVDLDEDGLDELLIPTRSPRGR